MNQKQINKQVFTRLEKLEKQAFRDPSNHPTKDKNQKNRKTLSDAIIGLREQDFFKTPKTAREVHEKLKPIYSCDLNRVEVALLRLRKDGQLRKTSRKENKKIVVAYVW